MYWEVGASDRSLLGKLLEADAALIDIDFTFALVHIEHLLYTIIPSAENIRPGTTTTLSRFLGPKPSQWMCKATEQIWRNATRLDLSLHSMLSPLAHDVARRTLTIVSL